MVFVDRLLGDTQLESAETRWRLRLLAAQALFGAPLAFLGTAFYVSQGNVGDAVPAVLSGVATAGGFLLWRQTRSLTLATHAAATVQLSAYILGTLLTGALPYLAWMAVVPLLVGYLRGLKAGTIWVGIALLATVGVSGLLLGTDLVHEPEVSTVVRLLRVVLLVPTVAVIGLMYELSYRETMANLLTARAAAEAASVEKSRFLASVSHEIRTPLNGVLGVTEVLLAGPLPPDVKDGVLTVHRSGGTLLALINDLLDVARAESGKLELLIAPFSLERLLRDTLALHLPRAKERGLALTSTLQRGTQDVYLGDSVRLKQVLGNLVTNAVKFSQGGTVQVRAEVLVEADKGTLRLSVTDTGPGISAADRLKLFQPFAQLRAEHSHTGTGLGLAIVRQLVEAMAGQVTIDSPPGQGATFTVTVPIGVAVGKGGLDDTPMPTARQLSGRVLVVDDNEINLRVAVGMLSKLGIESVCEGSGEAALTRMRHEHFDVVLMDLQMPGLDGFETTRKLRLDGCTVPVVALTASAGEATREQCRVAGMQECLTKPLRLAQLVVVLSGPCAAVPAPQRPGG